MIVKGNTRAVKAFKDAAKAQENAGKTILLEHELDRCCEIADAILAHPTASNLLNKAICEDSAYWMEGDQLCKCRPDAWRPDINVLADLKTTGDASPRFFQRNSYNLGYHISAAWYMRGIEAITGTRPDTWSWIVVETDAPYAVQVYVAEKELLAKGWEECVKALDRLKECTEANHWPAYSDEILPITLPAWAA